LFDPRPTAPRIPAGYGVPRDGSGAERLPWRWAVERLVAARCYWVCTTRRDGRPHAAPVWGLWRDGALWFSTDRASQKGRNLVRDGRVAVHLESGDETVILDGAATEERDRAALERFADEYREKYGFRPDPGSPTAAVFVVRPTSAQTWRERDYPETATRWVFD
jgi:PPOX class probable F420-dependent enzyme